MDQDWRGMAEGTELRELEGRPAGRASQRDRQGQPVVEGGGGCPDSLCPAKAMATVSDCGVKRPCPRVRALRGQTREAQEMRPSCVLI